jgi:AraC-like DNA-binding protein
MERHAVVLPYRGVFATHAGRRVPVLASSNHAVLLSAGIPYRYSYPAAIGDHCLVLSWPVEASDLPGWRATPFARVETTARGVAPVLPPAAVLARECLRRLLTAADAEPLAIQTSALALLDAVLGTLDSEPRDREIRRRRNGTRVEARVERVKQLVCTEPARRWTLEALAAAANVSAHHLAHEFKARVGVSVYEYVLRARLAAALEHVLDSSRDLTRIALDAGFSSHSHFTAHFRARFGTTPHALRGRGGRATVSDVRRIATATVPLAT